MKLASRKFKRIFLIAAVVVGVLLIAAITAFILAPREIITDLTRYRLTQAGLEKQVYHHDQGKITYFEGGQGPPMIFVHGLADQSGSWFRMAPKIENRRVLVVDLPRHGESPFETDEDALTDEVFAPLFDLFDERLGDESAVIVANSLGGWIAMEYALLRPDKVSQLILANSAGMTHAIDTTLIMPKDRAQARRTVRSIFGDSTPPIPGFVLDAIVERSGVSLASKVIDQMDEVEFLDDRLATLTTPTHLVWGDEDLIFPMDYARQLDEALPHSTLHVIPGCGHSPQVGCPDEFLDIVDAVAAVPD